MAGRLHELRGLGYASRLRVSTDQLPPGWRQEKKSEKYTVWHDSKGKKYRSSLEVERALTDLDSDHGTTDGELTDLECSPQKMVPVSAIVPCDLPNSLFVGHLSQIQPFLDSLSKAMRCSTPYCKGRLVTTGCSVQRRGGAASVHIACSGCGRQHEFSSTSFSVDRRNVVSYVLRLSAFATGIGYAGYHRIFGRYLGMNTTSDKMFNQVITEAYPHITAILDEICELGKEDMKAVSPNELGSWIRAVTTSDGCWQIRGFFSQNATFIIRNWLTGALLWYGHACMKGSDDNLYEGTAKSAEGYLAGILFGKAKEEGCHVEINWQDQDSSSEKSFRSVYSSNISSRVMKCGGHVGRSHEKALKDLKSKKQFDCGFISKHKEKFPEIEEVVCCCKGKRHSQTCGCFTDAFIQSARRNLYCAISQCGNNAAAFATRMREISKYHIQDVHKWNGGECDFHALILCSCGKCEDSEQIECEGKAYHTTNKLSCPLHILAYQIECEHRAEHAEDIIDPELGKGHSNACEATFSVFTKFRPKDVGLQKLHYQASTNLALIQSSMTYLYNKRGPNYHWILDLLKRMNLPLFDGIEEQCEADNRERMSKLKKQKESKAKTARIEHKKRRSFEQSKRKEWVKRQRIIHSYGDEDDELVDETDLREELAQRLKDNTIPHSLPTTNTSNVPDNIDFVFGGKKCKCGSTTHQRTSHSNCPLRKSRPSHSQSQVDECDPPLTSNKDATSNVPEFPAQRKRCRCGSLTHQRISHRDCPLKQSTTT